MIRKQASTELDLNLNQPPFKALVKQIIEAFLVEEEKEFPAKAVSMLIVEILSSARSFSSFIPFFHWLMMNQLEKGCSCILFCFSHFSLRKREM
jgi:hypothetical protein